MNKIVKAALISCTGVIAAGTIGYFAGYSIGKMDGKEKATADLKTCGNLHLDLTDPTTYPNIFLELESYSSVMDNDYVLLKVVKTEIPSRKN